MFKIIRKADIVLFFVLLALGIGLSIPGLHSSMTSQSPSSSPSASSNTELDGFLVEISVAGEPYGTYPLNQDAVIEIQRENHLNKVIIKDGMVQMEESNCKNQVCVKQGRISHISQNIICLPNRVVIRITPGNTQDAEGEGGEPDVISG